MKHLDAAYVKVWIIVISDLVFSTVTAERLRHSQREGLVYNFCVFTRWQKNSDRNIIESFSGGCILLKELYSASEGYPPIK